MKRETKKSLNREDKHLWKRVADTVTPNSETRGKQLEREMEKLMQSSTHSDSSFSQHQTFSSNPIIAPVVPEPYRPPVPKVVKSHPIEDRTLKRLAKGRQQIDSRIDLHGMTQDRARFALLDFLQMAQRSNHRMVLVITGKGNEGRGVLRQQVPTWFTLPEFSPYVNGIKQAHLSHGGDGALYVRVRKSEHSKR